MIWIAINIIFLVAGILLLTAGDYVHHRGEHTDFLESLMCCGGFGFIIMFILSEGIRRYPFG